MGKSRHSDSQFKEILKQAETGTPLSPLCGEHGVSNAMFNWWRLMFRGMDASMMKRLKKLELEYKRL